MIVISALTLLSRSILVVLVLLHGRTMKRTVNVLGFNNQRCKYASRGEDARSKGNTKITQLNTGVKIQEVLQKVKCRQHRKMKITLKIFILVSK